MRLVLKGLRGHPTYTLNPNSIPNRKLEIKLHPETQIAGTSILGVMVSMASMLGLLQKLRNRSRPSNVGLWFRVWGIGKLERSLGVYGKMTS